MSAQIWVNCLTFITIFWYHLCHSTEGSYTYQHFKVPENFASHCTFKEGVGSLLKFKDF